MTRTLQHIVATRQVTNERSKPVWDGSLRLKQHLNGAVDGPEFTAARDAVVAAIQTNVWFTSQDEWSDLHMVVDGLAAAQNAHDFDGGLGDLYDLADYDRIWIS